MAHTQMLAARAGEITEQMRSVAEKEFIDPEKLRSLVAAGKVVIPANINHPALVSCGIGRALRTKINANIGSSSLASCPGSEYENRNCFHRRR